MKKDLSFKSSSATSRSDETQKAMIVQDKRDIVKGKKDESANVSKMELKAG